MGLRGVGPTPCAPEMDTFCSAFVPAPADRYRRRLMAGGGNSAHMFAGVEIPPATPRCMTLDGSGEAGGVERRGCQRRCLRSSRRGDIDSDW